MGQLADLTIPAAELYVLRFCVELSVRRVPVVRRVYRSLLEFAQITWSPQNRGKDRVLLDKPPVGRLTSSHFNLIQSNAIGFSQLFVWFPPRTQPSGDESRLLVRAGVHLKFCAANKWSVH